MKRFWILLCSAMVACHVRPAPVPAPASSCEVLVSRREARIRFPSVERSTWSWNRPSDGRPNYLWTVYLLAPGIHIEVGRNAKGPEQQGNLATMLQSAVVTITWPRPVGDFDEERVVPELHPTVSGDQPMLVIRDAGLWHELFGLNRPQVADCRFWTPDSPDTLSVQASVRYSRFR